VVRLSGFHSTGRPDCQQDLYDPSRGRKHSLTSLFGSLTSQDAVLFQISRNAEALDSVVTSLPKILGCSTSSVIHISIQQRPIVFWDGMERDVLVIATGRRPLLGTALLDEQELVIQFTEGGLVTIDEL
jgi:hypothetical protein